MDDCTVVVSSCDDYEDTWELFFAAFRDNYSDCTYPIVLNTESKATGIDGVSSLNSTHLKGCDDWGERLINVLSKLTTKYVIMTYDDYVLDDVVDSDTIDSCISYMDENIDIAAFYLTNNQSGEKQIDDAKYNGFEKLNKKADYKLNSAPAVWNRCKLLSYLKNGDTPWAWEYFGSYRAYKTADIFYQLKSGSKPIYPYNMEGGAIYRGKWHADFVGPLLDKYNIDIDMNDRGVVSNDLKSRKRTLQWKIDFFKKGYQMIGINVLVFIFRILKHKISKKIGK